MKAVQRAEQALSLLSEQFSDWMEAEVASLETARDTFLAANDRASAVADVFRSAHDMKGQGETFGFPIAARAAANLTQFLEQIDDASAPVVAIVVDEHVKAIRAMLAEDARDESHPIALKLVGELEKVCNDLLSKSG